MNISSDFQSIVFPSWNLYLGSYVNGFVSFPPFASSGVVINKTIFPEFIELSIETNQPYAFNHNYNSGDITFGDGGMRCRFGGSTSSGKLPGKLEILFFDLSEPPPFLPVVSGTRFNKLQDK